MKSKQRKRICRRLCNELGLNYSDVHKMPQLLHWLNRIKDNAAKKRLVGGRSTLYKEQYQRNGELRTHVK